MLMILPCVIRAALIKSSIALAAHCDRKNGPFRFVANTWSQLSSVTSNRLRGWRRDPRVVDQHVEPAKLVQRLSDQTSAVGGRADIGLSNHGLAAGGLNQVDDLLSGTRARREIHHDAMPEPGQLQRNRLANAARAAGYNRHRKIAHCGWQPKS